MGGHLEFGHLTCTLCFLCAFNLDNKPLYLATFLSFIYAFGHFFTEFLIPDNGDRKFDYCRHFCRYINCLDVDPMECSSKDPQ